MWKLMKGFGLLLGLFGLPLPAQEYKVGFIGLRHHMAWYHLPRIIKGQSGPVKLVGIAETIPALVEEARKRGAADSLFYSDYKKMLEETKPDIVWGFVENNRHLEIMQACAPRRIHMIFQKPLSSTYKDAVAIRDLARKYGVRVLVNYDMAFYPVTHAAKAKADAGEVGKIWLMRGIVGHGGPSTDYAYQRAFVEWLTDPVQNGGGALVDFGSYNAAWALWYKGLPETVYATSKRLRPEKFPKVEDTAALVLTFRDGIGVFEASWDFPRGYQDLEVRGLQGSILTTEDKEVTIRKGREPGVRIDIPPLKPEMVGPMQYLAHCLTNRKPVEGLVALDLNVGVMEVLEAAKMSIKRGKAVGLPIGQ